VTDASVIGADAAAFSLSNGCATLQPGASCAIDVVFKPKAIGTATATIVVTSNDPTNPTRWVAVSGIGVAAPPPPLPLPTAVVTAGPVDFGTQALKVRTRARVVVVTNRGTAPLVVKKVAVGGRDAATFGVVNGCTVVAPGARCLVSVTFDPLSSGAKVATLVVTTNAPNGVKSVPLNGTGVRPTTAKLSNSAFGLVPVGGRLARAVFVTNTGSAPLFIRSVSATGAFVASIGTCGAPVGPGDTCHLYATFRPTAKVGYTATLRIASNATNNPTVLLSGKGR
jgi:hypothetical protein